MRKLLKKATLGVVGSKLTSSGRQDDATTTDSNAITQADWNRFRTETLPMIDRLTTTDRSIVEGAERSIANLAERSNEQIAKVNGRRLSQLSPAQQRLITQTVNADSAGTAAATLTGAEIQQRDVNDAARNNAMGFANALGNQGIGLLSNAEAMKTQREAQNRANKKGFMSSALGLVGTIGGAMIGGPVGASIGGAIGSSIGGSI
ncbi:MAG: hypothetical protein ACK4ML_00775 [Alishewanella aestuarii]